MSRLVSFCSAAALLVCAAGVAGVQAGHRAATLAVIMTNDPMTNQIKVYDVDTHVLLQTLSTHGKGGVGGNARGVKQYNGELFAAVNNGSNTVAIYKRDGNSLRFDKLVTTTSAPVSVDFGHDHLYVAGATTVDSFVLHRNNVEWMDGTTALELAGGGAPPDGSTAQVGVINERRLLVTLKTDPDPGTVDIVPLHDGAVTGAAPVAVSAPAGTLTPFGFSVYRRWHRGDHVGAFQPGRALQKRRVYVGHRRRPGCPLLDDQGWENMSSRRTRRARQSVA